MHKRIITVLKPTVLVELGTHGGGSYFSFCQSIKDNSLEAQAYAVDHWQGEEHAGVYSEVVYEQVAQINNEHFANFSTLLRKSFNDALNDFSDGSIDILHIDGFHSYDAVSTDFNNWVLLTKIRLIAMNSQPLLSMISEC